MDTLIYFYDVNAEYSDEKEIARISGKQTYDIIRVPSIGETVRVDTMFFSLDNSKCPRTKTYKVKEFSTKIIKQQWGEISDYIYLIGLEEVMK